MKHFILLALAPFCLAVSSQAQVFVEMFTNGSNEGAWTWGAGDQIVATGGNPGHYLRTNVIDTFAPQPRTSAGVSSAFTGDFRARQVDSLGIDLITFATQFPFQREVTLILENDAGTPGNPSDDDAVYFLSPGFVPQPGAGWASFDVAIPSQSATLPSGWLTLQGTGTNDQIWNSVITNVSRVRWFYGDPTFFFIFDIWQVGMDNPRIGIPDLTGAFCFGDGSGTPCPCGNNGVGPVGCANSTGVGARLRPTGGSASIAANDLVFTADGLPAMPSVLLFQGTAQQNGGAGVSFGDGKRCAGGSVVRLGTTQASGGVATWGPGLQHGITSPGIRTFQGWYRNAAAFCTPSTFNLTNGYEVAFVP